MKNFGKVLGKVCLILGIILALDLFGILGFTYPASKENQPLKHPIKVTQIQKNFLTLEDGRTVNLDPSLTIASEFDLETLSLVDFFSDRPREVDIEELNVDGLEIVKVFVADRQFICGTPWARLVTIPLIPNSFPRYRAKMLAYGEQSEIIKPNSEHDSGLKGLQP